MFLKRYVSPFSSWILGLLLLKLFLIFITPLAADESYYLLWAHHIDWSYVDHPPLSAWLTRVFMFFISDPLLAARSLALCTFAGAALALYKAAKHLGASIKAAQWAAIGFVLTPYNLVVGTTMQVDQTLILCTMLFLWAVAGYLTTQKDTYLYAIGLCAGLCFLSKYTVAVLLVLCVGVFFSKQFRALFLKTKVFISIGIFLLCLVPILLWNWQHHWVSFRFHTDRVGDSQLFQYTFDFLGMFCVYFSPIILFFWFKYRHKLQASTHSKWLSQLVFVGILIFAMVSISTRVYAHWPLYFAGPLWVAFAISGISEKPRLRYGLLGFNALAIALLLFTGPAVLTHFKEVQNNKKLYNEIHQLNPAPLWVASNLHGSVGQLSYYLQQPVYFPLGELKYEGSLWGEKQFELWGKASIKPHDTLLFYAVYNQDTVKQQLKERFERVIEQPHLKIKVLEDQLSNGSWWLCINAKKAFYL